MYDIRLEYWESQDSSFSLEWDYPTFTVISTNFIWQPAEIKTQDILIECPPSSHVSQDGTCVGGKLLF